MKVEGGGEGVSRRNFLGYIAGAAVTFLGVALGALGLGGILSPAFKPAVKGEWVSLGRLDSFTPGEPKKVDFVLFIQDGWVKAPSPRSVWVVREKENQFAVFNSRCTHLGCVVDWKEGSRGKAFYSPCHAGIFSLEGWVIAGPPPRPLDTLEYRIEKGELYCEYMDFVVGTPEKKPV